MKKKLISSALAMAMAASLVTFPASAAEDYGTVTSNPDGSATLNFGDNSITVSGGGSIISDDANGGIKRPDNLRTSSSENLAVLTLPAIDLNGKGYDKVDLYAASAKNAAVTIKVGDTETASFANVNNGSWNAYQVNTANLTSTSASGDVTLNIVGEGTKTYCGNYVYVKFYNSTVPSETAQPSTPQPTAAPTAPPADESTPLYLDESRSFEERAADLVSRMTLEEKVSQLGYTAPAIERLGVSKYNYWRECLHGVARQGKATNFPAPLALSNTWNRELVYKVADVTSTEARGKNNRYDLSYYTPTINMARDPRWGRNEETYGEDPYLTGQLAGEFVKGMQGDDEKYIKIIATIKHFAANNNERDRRGGASIMNEYNFRNYYLKPFQNVSEIKMPGSVMSSYNANSIYRNGELIFNYLPSAANTYLLTDVLRRTWGFDGYVTTDCGAGDDLVNNASYKNGILGTTTAANGAYIAAALKAGMDLECNLSGGNMTQSFGASAVLEGYISEEQLETSVYHLFLQRFRTGEFDTVSSYRNINASTIETDANVAVAEEAAEESIVMLKNDNFLPVQSVKKAVVVGSMANKLVLGDYTGTPTKNVTPLEGIKAEMGKMGASVEQLGAVSDDEKLFNIKSITLVLKDGKTRNVDLTKATGVTGMTASAGTFKDVTPKASAVIPNVDFQNVASVRVEMAQGALMGGSVNIGYGSGGSITVASIPSQATADTNTYAVCEGEYTGEDGGYNGKADMSISVSPAVTPFSVEAYKAELDAADVIIAYAATIPKQEGLGDPDSSESRDRADINLPSHQAHVQEICNAYPNKTVVVMSTVGQINVEPFMNKCKAILWTSYNGQTQGTALGKVLTGETNPSGRLSTTWYKNDDIAKLELSHHVNEEIGGIKGYYTNYDIQPTAEKPGNTYQYYKNAPIYPFGYGLSYTSFEYSNAKADTAAVDANGTIKLSVDVKNTGAKAGKEVVQLYVAPPQGGNAPKKQLKNFEKISLDPGETKTVEFNLDVKDLAAYQEASQKTEVASGEYTAYIAKNADDTANAVKFNVTGTLESKLNVVKAMPDGVSVNGYVCGDGTGLESGTVINANVSASMTDEAMYDLSKAAVTYTISDNEIAAVSENGVVTSGAKEGAATVTVSVTIDGITKTDSFPVVNKLEVKPSDDELAAAKAALKEAYDKLPKAAYSADGKAELDKIYSDSLAAFDIIKTKDALDTALALAINDLNSVVMDNLIPVYRIESVNPKYIEKGVIDYREGGIPMYSGATGTITVNNPSEPIALAVKDENGNAVSGVIWQIKKFDNSKRKVADIDNETGVLTVYGNGIIQITAVDVNTLKSAVMMVHVNMQIEGEYADEGNGANLTDAQKGASGGRDAGSTGNSWMEYKSVKLSNLEGITVRYAGKNAGKISISLDKNALPENVIASLNASATGGWSTWTEQPLELDNEVLAAVQKNGLLDEYGCATVYIQTNGTNLDYFRMDYIENDDDVPYIIEKVLNKADGKVKVTVKYRGSTLAVPVTLKAEIMNSDGSVKNTVTAALNGTGETEIATGASNGEKVCYTVVDKSGKALSEICEAAYTIPVDSEIVVYSLDSTDYDYSVLTGGENGTAYEATVNGLSGYGAWSLKNASASYTYVDVNEKSYEYSFTKSWNAGEGKTTNRSLCFTPKAPCKVTAVFKGSEEARSMKINQNGTELAVQPGTGTVAAVSAQITDTENPVYIYGGKSGKDLFAVIVEYYGSGEDPKPTTKPTQQPTTEPTTKPTQQPTTEPTTKPTQQPTTEPTTKPTTEPTTKPTTEPVTSGVSISYSGAVTINSDRVFDAVLIAADYEENGALKSVVTTPVSVNVGITTVPMMLMGGEKLMLWNTLGSMTPVCDAITVLPAPAGGEDIAVQYQDWNDGRVVLTENDATGDTKVWNMLSGDQRVELQTEYFYESDVQHNYGDKYTINVLGTYKDRLYAGCDDGLVIVFTNCVKCYKLKKVCDFDVKSMEIADGCMIVSDGENSAVIDMNSIGGDAIEPDEAYSLMAKGAVLVDVRSAEEFAAGSADGAVNIALDELETKLAEYDTDTTIIFICGSGMRASSAVETAKRLGYINVYNGGSADRF